MFSLCLCFRAGSGPLGKARGGSVLAARALSKHALSASAATDPPLKKLKTIDEAWDLDGLRKEIVRVNSRVVKKITKAYDRLHLLQAAAAAASAASAATASTSTSTSGKGNGVGWGSLGNSVSKSEGKKEGDKTIPELEQELAELRQRLEGLNQLEADAKLVRTPTDNRYKALILRAIELEVSDAAPERTHTPRVKPPKVVQGPRKPYHVFTSSEGIKLKVGRSAEDNDLLSMDPIHREGNEWWLHVAGYPGSHVVICCSDDDLPRKYRTTLKEAALLTADKSKAPPSNNVIVTYTRCRYVTKPKGFKAGQVLLKGPLNTIGVNLSAQKKVIENLMATKE